MKAGAVAYISDLTNQDHILRIVKINIIIIINAEGNLLVAKTFSLYFSHADMFFPDLESRVLSYDSVLLRSKILCVHPICLFPSEQSNFATPS